MDTSLFKLALTSQTIFGAVQFLVVLFVFGGVLAALQFYHANDRLTFGCSLKLNDFTRQLCYDKYTSTMSPWLIPRDVVAIIYGILCVCWISFLLYSAMTIRQINRDRQAEPNRRQAQWGKLRCVYIIHVLFRVVFLGVMIGIFCSSQALHLPSVFKCSVHTPQTNKTVISVNQTESTMQCNDLHYKAKSNLNIVILVIEAFVLILGIFEVLQLTLIKRNPFHEMLIGNVFEETNNLDMGSLLARENNSSGETKNNGNQHVLTSE